MTTPTWIETLYSNKKTKFTTTVPNVKIISVDYTIPPYQTVSGIKLALYNSTGTVVATSNTVTSQSAGASPAIISNIFNYTIATAGNYSIGIYSGTGNVGGDNPVFPITESTGTINVTGVEMSGSAPYHCFNNIQFSVANGLTAPIPSTVTAGTTNYTVTQTVNGCTSSPASISVVVTAPPAATISYGATAFCKSVSSAQSVNRTGTSGGTYSVSPSGLTINSSTGAIVPSTSTAGTYTVTYTMAAVNGCSAQTATTSVTIANVPSATISYNGSPYCSGSGTASVSRTGTSGGTFSSTTGLNINSSTGEIDLVNSTPGTYTVTYTIAAVTGCATYTATNNITITPKVSSLAFAAGSSSTRCQGLGTVTYSATANNATGITYSLDATSLAAGNSINSSTGAVTFVADWKGTSSIKALAAGCTPLSATHTVTTSPAPSGSISTTYTCIDGSSGTITTTGNTGISPFTYSLNSGTFQSSGNFTGLASGNYSIQIKSNDGCIYSTSATVDPYPNSSGDQNVAATDSWVGHMYNGKSFDQYKGFFSESEIFDENFGGSGTCFSITSGVSGSSIYTDQFSVKFKMNSTRTGLYVVDLGSDDGSRLTVDGDVIFDDWNDHAFAGRPRVLMNLDGNNSLLYEFYENGGENRVLFNNLALVLENKLSSNLTQSICMGNSGTAIGGDTYGTLPSGISKYGSTGYQWSYSTTVGGIKVAISGATDATFTPNTSNAPFNTPGTYYVYRNAILSSTNNTGKSPYVATNFSNAAVIIINAIPSATISYGNNPFCSTSSLPEKVMLAGTSGGIFSASGLQINSATGDIVPNSNSVGLYTVNYLIPAAGGCSAFSTSVQIYIGAPGTWSGKISKDWANSGNWVCGIMPDGTTDVIIPKQVSNFPSVISHYAEAKNLHIATGASLTVLGTLEISGAISNNGNLDIAGGTLEMSGAAGQSIAGSIFASHTVKNLVVSNTSAEGLSVSSTPNDTLKLTGTLSFGNSNSILNTGDNVALISNYDGTANVSVVGSHNAINGKAIVEKYINTGTDLAQHGKSWQFLSAPTSGQTIKESWMENGNIPANYGTIISGPGGTAAGFDMYSVAPSMKYFDETINNWKGVSSANNPIANTGGYMVFIRGDRTVTGTTQAANRTVLRSKGTLFTGTQMPITVKANSFQSVGNPYASPIDFALITKDPSIDNAFYVYDPYLYGTYGVGGYQVLSSVNNWKPVPGGTSAYPSSVLSSIIQSGQAFFVHSNSSTDGSLTISEASKSATARPGHSNRETTATTDGDRQFLRASLFTSAGLMADGNVVTFDKTFRNTIDGNDVIKLSNSGENFGIKSAGKLLIIEAKSQLSGNDTITYNVTNLSKATYKLIFAPENMAATGLQGILIDKYLKTETPVSLRDSTVIEVTTNTNAASSAADRFKLVFRQLAALPVNISSITAVNKEGKNLIHWSVENESGIRQYAVEKSTDGNQFSQMAMVNANHTESGDYISEDSNVNAVINYYRVRIVSKDDKVSYSPVVKVNTGKIIAAIEVTPNPILNGTIHLVFSNEPSGKYTISLSNQLGQVILSKTILHTAESASESISANSISKGIYNLLIVKPDGNKQTVKIIY